MHKELEAASLDLKKLAKVFPREAAHREKKRNGSPEEFRQEHPPTLSAYPRTALGKLSHRRFLGGKLRIKSGGASHLFRDVSGPRISRRMRTPEAELPERGRVILRALARSRLRKLCVSLCDLSRSALHCVCNIGRARSRLGFLVTVSTVGNHCLNLQTT